MARVGIENSSLTFRMESKGAVFCLLSKLGREMGGSFDGMCFQSKLECGMGVSFDGTCLLSKLGNGLDVCFDGTCLLSKLECEKVDSFDETQFGT